VVTTATSAPALNHHYTDSDQKLTTRSVARRYDVSVRTIDRWLGQAHMAFPKPTMATRDITGRVANRYWRLSDLITWEQRQAVSSADLRNSDRRARP
jgi:hypothetical protein